MTSDRVRNSGPQRIDAWLCDGPFTYLLDEGYIGPTCVKCGKDAKSHRPGAVEAKWFPHEDDPESVTRRIRKALAGRE